MKKVFALCLAVTFLIAMQTVIAAPPNVTGGPLKKADEMKTAEELGLKRLDSRRPDAPWIMDWYGPDGGYMDNGGFAVSAPIDLISEGSGGKLTQVELSTMAGLLKTKTVMLEGWGDHLMVTAKPPAKGDWRVLSLGDTPDAEGGRNMSSRYGLPCQNNFDTYQIIVINAPGDMKAVMSPSQDDHAQIWINGEKWFNDAVWTGNPVDVDFDIEIDLKAGGNVLLYRCGESGGHDYANLHLDDSTMGKVKIYPDKAKKASAFFNEIAPSFGVAPKGKLPSVWGDVKSINQ